MAEGSPARIDRAALERIIQRAAELQTSEREIGDNLTPDEVIALGKEVGIPGRYLQQALLEERTRLTTTSPAGIWEHFAGAADTTAHRVLRGQAGAAEQALLDWMETNELLCVQRRQAGRITWEPIGGVQAAIRRSTSAITGSRPFMLSRCDTVTAALVDLEPGWCHVSLSASARKARGEYVGGGAAVAGAGLAGAGLMVVLGALLPVALIPVPLGLGLGYALGRRYGPTLARIQLGLERALDFVEQGAARPEHQLPPRRPRILDLLASEVRKALRS